MSDAVHESVVVEDDKPNLLFIFAMMAGLIIVLIALVVGVVQYFNEEVRDEVQRKQLDVQNSKLREQRAKEAATLSHYRWADQKAGVVAIPVERAVELTLRDWSKRPNTVIPAEATPTPPTPAPGAENKPGEQPTVNDKNPEPTVKSPNMPAPQETK